MPIHSVLWMKRQTSCHTFVAMNVFKAIFMNQNKLMIVKLINIILFPCGTASQTACQTA